MATSQNYPPLWLADVVAKHAPYLIGPAAIEMECCLEEDNVIHLMHNIMKDENRVKILMEIIRSMWSPRQSPSMAEMIAMSPWNMPTFAEESIPDSEHTKTERKHS
ncbi:MAG TPA: hypothetical protein VMU10_11035 [Desulfomonilia bacterium]|nr:hypothetical protein [Desulfomonilia bacterium]